MESGETSTSEQDLRQRALERIKRKRDFARHVVTYLVINAGLWVIWAVDGANTDDLWPAWVNGIWLAILVIDGFKVYGERPITDQQVDDEVRRMGGA